MSEEIELKLEVQPEDAARLMRCEALTKRGVRFNPAREQISTYYDTPRRALARKGIALRVRRAGAKIVQTVKTDGDGGVVARRGEWEWPLATPEPDLALALESDLKPLVKRQKKGDLAPVFATHVKRRVALLTMEGATLELAMDEGEIVADGGALKICELEIEVKEGAPAALFSLAREIVSSTNARVAFASKAARGFALVDGDVDKVARAGPVILDPDMRVVDAAAAVIDSCAAQAATNLPLIARTRAPEAIHQSRVALRRLRAALGLFKEALPADERKRLSKRAGRLASALGPARDLDVLATGAVAAAEPPEGLKRDVAALRKALAEARREAWDAAVEAASGADASLLLLDLSALSAALRAAPADPAAPLLAPYAAERLEARYGAALTLAPDIAALAVEQRHDLRLALKKLRYAADFLESLYPPRAVRQARKALTRLQEGLGAFNDAAVAARLLADLAARAAPRRRASLERAALFVTGWAASDGGDAWRETCDRWAGFTKTEPFWR